jgi:hypothetical protein
MSEARFTTFTLLDIEQLMNEACERAVFDNQRFGAEAEFCP